jgi:uncharacterized protein (DUF2384 family)
VAVSTSRRTRPDAAPPRDVDLLDPAARRRLTRSAVPALLTLASAWDLTDQRAADLLGGVSLSTLRRWKKAPPDDLGVDGLTRASYLLGIYRALHVILDDANADAWLTLPNSGPMFGGRTPLDVITRGGIPAMERVRVHLDAVRGG